ncbi:MAG: Na/Pi cotransporter family protein [Spirochaetes bacterium]|nr:Na/Pi cotransporter family protein [Spirochaetota bacterium]
MLDLFDEWKFIAGLGIFLFGMFMMEESIKLLAGRSFKSLIRRYTGTRIKGLLTGFISTAILQSSSAVSLMVLAFVGAGLMSFANAIAVIMGAKVGTTLTAWIVVIFGFSFKIDAFALPMIGIGGLGLIFLSGSVRYVNISKLIAAFGFLFLGLDFMKTSVEGLAAQIDPAFFPDLGLWVYAFAGIVLTAVMQSSSATIAVILTALFSNIINFGQGAAMVIGANIGTTVTILMGSIGGIPAKKRTALSSLLFTVGTSLITWPFLPLLFWIIRDVFGLSGNPVLGIAAFHTQFNIIGVLIFSPLIPRLSGILERLFPEKRTVLTRFIQNTNVQVPEAAIPALRKEILHQLSLSIAYISRKYRLHPANNRVAGITAHVPLPADTLSYKDMEGLHAEIFAFYARLHAYEINQQEAVQLESLIRSSRSIMNATQNLYELLYEIEDIGRDDHPFMADVYLNFRNRLKLLCDTAEKVSISYDDTAMPDMLAGFFKSVEDMDRQFIQSCAKAVSTGTILENEVTRLLMANRLFTQSCRMLVLSMQTLTKELTK